MSDDPMLAWKLKNGWVPGPGDIVTAEETILLKVNADRMKDGEDYCVLCAEGPFPIKEMRLITPEEDPYIQMEPTEEGEEPDPVRACQPCFEKMDGEGEEGEE